MGELRNDHGLLSRIGSGRSTNAGATLPACSLEKLAYPDLRRECREMVIVELPLVLREQVGDQLAQ